MILDFDVEAMIFCASFGWSLVELVKHYWFLRQLAAILENAKATIDVTTMINKMEKQKEKHKH